ncbi:transposase [Brucella cytisi]|uniref:transposase n=1 Tax=Brucella cytisi TaxID=407152 RepID=UPI0008FC7581|nr:transposase [Brucella cytisi]
MGPDNPVRFIEAFVDGLDLAAAGFIRVTARETERPGIDQADLLKLYVYGYINRVRPSRRLEAETHSNIEVIWLLRHQKPDFRTIADFCRVNRSFQNWQCEVLHGDYCSRRMPLRAIYSKRKKFTSRFSMGYTECRG